MKITIHTCDVYSPLPHRDSPIDDVATFVSSVLRVYPRIVCPEFRAGGCVDCIYAAPGAGRVHGSIHDHRCRLQPSSCPELILPGETQPIYVIRTYLIERRIVSAVDVTAGREPLIRLALGICEPLRIHSRRSSLGETLRF